MMAYLGAINLPKLRTLLIPEQEHSHERKELKTLINYCEGRAKDNP